LNESLKHGLGILAKKIGDASKRIDRKVDHAAGISKSMQNNLKVTMDTIKFNGHQINAINEALKKFYPAHVGAIQALKN